MNREQDTQTPEVRQEAVDLAEKITETFMPDTAAVVAFVTDNIEKCKSINAATFGSWSPLEKEAWFIRSAFKYGAAVALNMAIDS